MDAFDFYRVYKPVHLHFTQEKFDLMQKRCRCTEKELEARNDRSILFNLASKIPNRKDAAKLCVSNFAAKDYWLTDSIKEIEARMQVWRAYRKHPLDAFKSDLETLSIATQGRTLTQVCTKTPSGNLAPVLQMWSKGQLSSDFVCTLDKARPFIDEIDDFWFRESGAKLRLTKNRPFIKIDEDSISNIITSIYKEL